MCNVIVLMCSTTLAFIDLHHVTHFNGTNREWNGQICSRRESREKTRLSVFFHLQSNVNYSPPNQLFQITLRNHWVIDFTMKWILIRILDGFCSKHRKSMYGPSSFAWCRMAFEYDKISHIPWHRFISFGVDCRSNYKTENFPIDSEWNKKTICKRQMDFVLYLFENELMFYSILQILAQNGCSIDSSPLSLWFIRYYYLFLFFFFRLLIYPKIKEKFSQKQPAPLAWCSDAAWWCSYTFIWSYSK